MKKVKHIAWIIVFFVLLFLGYETSVFGIENYTLKPLFELKAGRGIDEFRLTFAPAPFAPVEGRKTPLSFTGTHALVDNSGNFYLLKERTNIIKIGPKGEVITEIRGSKPFTVPMRMRLDGEDNLYVMFSNDTNIAEEWRYAVAKFNNKGELLHWIGDQEGFKCIFFGVNINGTVSVTSCVFEDALKYKDQFQRYDKNGRFIGLFTHRGISDKDTVDSKGLHIISIRHILAVGANGNAYVVNDHHSPDGRLQKRVEVGKNYYVDVFDLSRPLTFECFRYDFDQDKYDSLVCEAVIEKEGEFATIRAMRNYMGELYELVIFFNDPPNVTPADHVRFYKWEQVQ
jgi:hypothetical protein